MRPGGRRPIAFNLALVAIVAACAPATASAQTQTRYSIVHGCYSLQAGDKLVAKTADNGYAATATGPDGAEVFRMQATDLGRYLLYGRARDFLASGGGGTNAAAAPSDAGDWQVDEAGGGKFTLTLPANGKALAVGDRGALVLGEAAGATAFAFVPASGCPEYPEVQVSEHGEPLKAGSAYGEVAGFIDAHIHGMAFEFLGGGAHCGRPWHPYGAPAALVDCPDHYPGGAPALLENVLSYGNPARTHDPVGWPTFKDWPAAKSLTHEQTYYKWVERAWRGGLRMWVNLMVDNAVLCELYPIKKHGCDEMDSVRKQIRDIHAMQDYIDAQNGGPGKGWFRIVTDPFQARRVVAQGKLAVVLGIEVSKLFGCGEHKDVPECSPADIDRQLDEVYNLGIRDLEIVNKFDNALAGVAGDNGSTGAVVNTGNYYATGSFWQLQTCTGPDGANDREQTTVTGRDAMVGNGLAALLPPGLTPVYPPPPHCNTRGLTPLGEHLIRRMIAKHMIVDPDHMSVLARNHTLSILESEKYSGVVSSHSWSTPDAFPRIYALGGFVTPYAGNSTSFVDAWRKTKAMRSGKYYFGFGYGADMNGFGAQGNARPSNTNPVKYPFKSFDGGVTLDKQRSGERVYDINVDGVAHYGLYPDWIEDLRQIAGDEIVRDMARGPEAYLQMWERAEGVPAARCGATRARFTRRGLLGAKLGQTAEQLLRRRGQPGLRPGRAWTWCVDGDANRTSKLVTVLTPAGRVRLIATSARYHKASGLAAGVSADRIPHGAESYGPGLLVAPARSGARYVYGVKRGRISFVAVATRAAAKTAAGLRADLKLAGLL